MLVIQIDETELFDDVTQIFSHINKQTLHLEHSLISISKWEANWNKPFLNNQTQTIDEFRDYVKCMTLDKNVDETAYLCLSVKNIKEIQNYIDAPMTATKFFDSNKKKSVGTSKRITSELIYYWMITFNIPFECEKWHLNRLMTLIKICQNENQPREKTSQKAKANNYAAINAARRKALNTHG